MDPFASDTSAHESFIHATLEAETNHKLFSGSKLEGGLNGTDFRHSVDVTGVALGGAHENFHPHGEICGYRNIRSREKHTINISSLAPTLRFGLR